MDEPVTERLVEVDGVPVRVRTERQRLAITEGELWTDVSPSSPGAPAAAS